MIVWLRAGMRDPMTPTMAMPQPIQPTWTVTRLTQLPTTRAKPRIQQLHQTIDSLFRTMSVSPVWTSETASVFRLIGHLERKLAGAGERVRTGGEEEGVDDKVGVITGREGGARNFERDVVNVIADAFHHLPGVATRVVEAFADFLGVSREWLERNVVIRDKTSETMRRAKFDAMPSFLQTNRQREVRLHIAARTVGENGNIHGKNFTRRS